MRYRVKACTKCAATKPLADFPRHKGKPYSWCKACHCKVQAKRRAAKRDEINARQREVHKVQGHRYKAQQAQYRMFTRYGGDTPENKAYLLQLAQDPCAYCGGRHSMQFDHIVPKDEGGENQWSNITAACKRCNSSKQADSLLYFLARQNGCYEWRRETA